MEIENPDPPRPTVQPNDLRPRGLLYHYTTVEGFLGVLDSDSLRATHIRYLNDSREFVDALEHKGGLIEALVDEFDRCNADFRNALASSGNRFSGEFEGLLTSLTTGFGEFLNSIGPRVGGRSGAYVVSFTDDAAQESRLVGEPGDRLSQWRAYGGRARGISMGFDFDALHGGPPGEAWRLGGSTTYLLNCLYRQEEKRAALKAVADLVIPNLRAFLESSRRTPEDPSDNESLLSAFRLQTMLGWVLNASTFKDSAFSEEKEWRVVILGPSKRPRKGVERDSTLSLKFRSGPLGVTPYLDFPLGLSSRSSPLRRVVLGPTPHVEESINAAKMILEEKGITLKSEEHPDGVEVAPSQIPYRNW